MTYIDKLDGAVPPSDLVHALDNVDTWDGPLVDSLWPELVAVAKAAEGLCSELQPDKNYGDLEPGPDFGGFNDLGSAVEALRIKVEAL